MYSLIQNMQRKDLSERKELNYLLSCILPKIYQSNYYFSSNSASLIFFILQAFHSSPPFYINPNLSIFLLNSVNFSKMKNDIKQISTFFSNYHITYHDQQTQIIQSKTNLYLIKTIKLLQQNSDIDNVIQTLEQHLTLNDQHILTLLNYEVVPNQSNITISTIYQYASVSLKEQIINRRQKMQYFRPQQLWMIVYSITKALQYLQNLNIAYGVLDCDKIFLGEKVKLLDPSAIAEDPLSINGNRLYSPEILKYEVKVDIIKSDVFIFGLCLLEAALLLDFNMENRVHFDQTRLKIYLNTISEMNLLAKMLQYYPQNRPTFLHIKQYLQNTLQLTAISNESIYAPLQEDSQDYGSESMPLDENIQHQNIDLQQEQDQCSSSNSQNMSEYQRAKQRFFPQVQTSLQSSLSRINENSASSMILNESKSINIQKKKVTKSIKQKVVKNMKTSDLEIIQIKQYKRNDHLFTNPKLMEDIQKQLKIIAKNRNNHTRQNVASNY